jgi:hypothetical protein
MEASMAEDSKKPEIKLVKSVPDDAIDMDSLWLDSSLGDGITDFRQTSIPFGKPRDYFQINPDLQYRRRAEIYVHRPEGALDEQTYILSPRMRGRIEEARPCTIVLCIDRAGNLRLWALKFPRENERDNEAWVSARNAARQAQQGKWIKLVWATRAYKYREALEGYAPNPDWGALKLPPFNDLVTTSLGRHGIINDTNHPIYRELFGAPPLKAKGNDDEGGDDLL